MIGKEIETVFEYNWKDVVLYALGIGAQTNELSFIYERAPSGLKVFPSFTVIAADGAVPIGRLGKIDFSRFIHGEQLIQLYQPLPPKGKIIRKGSITDIYDKGKGAVIHSQISGFNENGDHIFDAKWVHFYIGAGGFGGDPGPKTEILNSPEGVEPDFSISYKTTENQAALYRLNGDLNPLHIDPEFARKGGQEKPILHGLCTFGFASRAILYGACKGDVTRFKKFKGRFSNVVYPGETLITEGWKDEGRYIIQVRTNKTVVVSNAYAIVE